MKNRANQPFYLKSEPRTIAVAFVLFMAILSSCNTDKERKEESLEPVEQKESAITTIYKTPKHAPTVGAMYPRVVRLKHYKEGKGNILVTFEHYMNREPSFPIYRSTDDGETWHLLSEVEDTKNGFGNRYQPHLFELPRQVGEFPAGTLFLSGSSIPDDLSSTELVVYVSKDGGESWEYLSSIVEGGRAIYPNEGETPVWEPFLGLDASGNLVAYYSDERYYDDGYSQILAHKVSKDGGRTWGEVVFDVAVPDNKTRPGMPVITQLPTGKYLMILEVVGYEGVPVYYKISEDGLDWGDETDLGTMIQNEEGHFLKSTPYVIWTPFGGEKGTLVASGMGINVDGELVGNGYMINKNLGEGPWEHIPAVIEYETGYSGTPGGYSQSMVLLDDEGREILQVIPVPTGEGRHMDIKSAKFLLPE
ncbi:sialidase family protein [Flagellimonas sp. GZD32]|uniref:sialidase family protein n=1 Tax=Flagellimonas cixiensis TaxID=3228750 RepID=UPI0035C8B4B3